VQARTKNTGIEKKKKKVKDLFFEKKDGGSREGGGMPHRGENSKLEKSGLT